MKDIDKMIRDALNEEDAELYEKFGENQPIHEVITDLFRFQPRLLLIGSIIVTIAAMALAVYAALQFYETVEVKAMFFWSAIWVTCIVSITGVKIWAWMEMSKNAMIREIKRLELQTAHLSASLKKSRQ